MVLFGDIFKEVVDAMRAHHSPDEQEFARRRLNNDMLAIAKRDSWADLRVRKELEWNGEPTLLPSNLIGIDLVWDDMNGIEYHHRNRSVPAMKDISFRYVLYPAETPLATVKDATLQQDATTFSSLELEAKDLDLVGEYCIVDGEQQVYEITEQDGDLFTISPGYRGTGTKSASRITVRPQGTQLLELQGPRGLHLTTTSFELHYWRLPDTLRDDHDMVPFPTADVLTFRSISRIPQARQLRPISQTQVDTALQEALSLNPDKPKPRVLKDRGGRDINFNDSFYSPRTLVGGAERTLQKWRM